MRHKYFLFFLLLLIAVKPFAQQPGAKLIRIVDTLTVQEKANRYPVLLKSEIDSLIRQFNSSQLPQIIQQPEKETVHDIHLYLVAGIIAIIVLLGIVIYLFFRYQQKINQTINSLRSTTAMKEPALANILPVTTKDRKGKASLQTLENRISELTEQLYRLSKEKEGLDRVINEYKGIQQEYDSLRHNLLQAYKVKNYPGYDKTKDETVTIQGVLQTENSVALYAYEKFLKPILAITDANKNNPAKLTDEDQEKIVNLLVSLSLLHIEYLYLRVNDLSIGGKMVERIHGFRNGNGIDASLLKKLNTESGSRALVIKMALNKAGLDRLSYPVFDETNLNNQ